MKAIRSTMYGPDLEAVTVIVRADQLNVSVEEFVNCVPGDGVFIVNDVFDCEPDAESPELSIEALQRQQEAQDREQDAAILYYWTASSCATVHTAGVVMGKDPAPLPAEMIEDALKQVARHPSYERQMIMFVSEDGRIVELKKGKVQIRSM